MQKIRIRQRDVVYCPWLEGLLVPVQWKPTDSQAELDCNECAFFSKKTCYYITCNYPNMTPIPPAKPSGTINL
jgi:hypothetical protein